MQQSELDKDIDSLLDLYNYPPSRPPSGNVDNYKAMLQFKIKKLLRQKFSDIQGTTDSDFNQLMQQLRAGKKVEKEHTDDELEAEKIALDHLSEDPAYYTKLSQIHKESKPVSNNLNFKNIYELAEILEREELGLIEHIKIEGIDAELTALIDSGNGAYNVLHGINIEDSGAEVQFTTIDGITLKKEKVDEITIHVGAGHDEHRPVVEFTIEIGNKVYPDVRFSIGDRTENQHPVLVGADFLSQIDALIDVNKTKTNTLS